jgi:transcriptional regulator with XRE-family HTH domain
MDWKTLIAELMDRGWTQQRLAELAGCKQPTISDLKRGDLTDPRDSVGSRLRSLHAAGLRAGKSAEQA